VRVGLCFFFGGGGGGGGGGGALSFIFITSLSVRP